MIICRLDVLGIYDVLSSIHVPEKSRLMNDKYRFMDDKYCYVICAHAYLVLSKVRTVLGG